MLHIGLTRQEVDHLQNVIARLDAQRPGPGADLRAYPRIDFTQPLWINLAGEPGRPWVRVYSRNLSTSGLGFLTRNLFYAGQHLVAAHDFNECQPMLVLCRVCYCRPIDMGILEVGLAFVSARPDPEDTREVPVEWLTRIVQCDVLSRRKFESVSGF